MKLNILKSSESLAENKIKNEIQQLVLKYKHENDIHEHRKQQKKMSHINLFILDTSQRLNLISSNKHVALQNLSIYYTWKNKRK